MFQHLKLGGKLETFDAPAETFAIELENVSCNYGSRTVLRGINLRVRTGEIIGLVGQNGAGKTTLINVLCRLQSPSPGIVSGAGGDERGNSTAGAADRGQVRMFGQMPPQSARGSSRNSSPNTYGISANFRARIGVLPQETALYEQLSAQQNLQFAATLYAVSDSKKRINEVLEIVGLLSRRSEVVSSFSGGMKRRLAIARALLHDPELLILDEPTLGVDAQSRHQIWNYIRKLKNSAKTVVLSTNYLDEAQALCDRIIMLHEGEIIADQTPAHLLEETGTCLEIIGRKSRDSRESREISGPLVEQLLSSQPGVKRIEVTETGILVYLGSHTNPEELVQLLRGHIEIQNFRSRSPDLAEIFQHFAVSTSQNSRGLRQCQPRPCE